MEKDCLNRVLPLVAGVVMFAVVCGCGEEKGADASRTAGGDAATNAAEAAVAPSTPLTPEEKEAAEMRDLLDDGQTQAAMRHARNLMDSKSRQVRSQVVETLAWIGHRALPEITEMINDSDPEIAEEALSAWEQAFSEVSGDHRQAAIIKETVPQLKNPDSVSVVLQRATEFDEGVALAMLADIIDANATNFVGECARDMYKHISGGEIYARKEDKNGENK